MTRAIVTKTIAAPIDRVFETIADVESFGRAIPDIVSIDFLSQRRAGDGTRFRETRLRNGKEATTDLEITECVANERIRMVADSHGTIWDTLFAVKEVATGTELTLTMDAKAHQVVAKLMNAMVMPAIRGVIETDLDSVKQYCEAARAGNGPG
jgi:carbon monoxide dehydrogenase subunit G